ncbi:hypothetical protein [Dyella silvatica]|uniref:hypothetical protein n=1 Tax=Dyella silvatica TaxID=2992128 RepID=UPI0022530613|nr:hypothetical protein [Dyella silvatica]
MKSIHFVGEWFECRAPAGVLADPQAIQARCMQYIAGRHLPISYAHFTTSASDGVIGAMTGKGIHLVLRTFPRDNTVIADLHADQEEAAEISAAMRVFDSLRDEFRPMRALLHRVQPCGQALVGATLPGQGRTPRAPTEVLMSTPLRRVG